MIARSGYTDRCILLFLLLRQGCRPDGLNQGTLPGRRSALTAPQVLTGQEPAPGYLAWPGLGSRLSGNTFDVRMRPDYHTATLRLALIGQAFGVLYACDATIRARASNENKCVALTGSSQEYSKNVPSERQVSLWRRPTPYSILHPGCLITVSHSGLSADMLDLRYTCFKVLCGHVCPPNHHKQRSIRAPPPCSDEIRPSQSNFAKRSARAEVLRPTSLGYHRTKVTGEAYKTPLPLPRHIM